MYCVNSAANGQWKIQFNNFNSTTNRLWETAGPQWSRWMIQYIGPESSTLNPYGIFYLSTTGYGTGVSDLLWNNIQTNYVSLSSNNTSTFTITNKGYYKIVVKINSDSNIAAASAAFQLFCYDVTNNRVYERSESGFGYAWVGTSEMITEFLVYSGNGGQWKIQFNNYRSGITWTWSASSWTRMIVYKIA
jgi:hypothetical protein